MAIFNQTTGTRVCYTGTGTTLNCNANWTQNPQTYRAYVSAAGTTDPPPGIKASSNILTVSPAAFAVTLTVPKTELTVGESAIMTATSNQNMSGSGYTLAIFNQTTGTRVCYTGTGTTLNCNANWTQNPQTYRAYVSAAGTTDPPPGIKASSNTLTVSPLPFTVTLTVPKTELTVGESAIMTATSSQNLSGSGYTLAIFNQTSGAKVCSVTTGTTLNCNANWTQNPQTYRAYVSAAAATDPPPGIKASSNTLTVSPLPFTVTLTVPKTELAVGEEAIMTATSNQNLSGSGYTLAIFNQTSGVKVCSVTTGMTLNCNANWTQNLQTYRAYVSAAAATDPPPGIKASSNILTVSPLPFTVTLTVAETVLSVGGSTGMTASIDQSLNGSGYTLAIFDRTSGARMCAVTTGASVSCNAPWTQHPHTYRAYVSAAGTADPPPGIAGTSNAVTISPAAFNVTLTAPDSVLAVGHSTTLTATVDQDPATSGFTLSIFNITTGTRLCHATTGTTLDCPVGWTQGAQSYLAFVSDDSESDPPANVQATSNAVRIEPSGFTVGFVTTGTEVTTTDHVTVTATVNQTLTGSGYAVGIFDRDTGDNVKWCWDVAECMAYIGAAGDGQPHAYIAYVGPMGSTPPPNPVATSAPIYIHQRAWALTATTADGVMTATANQSVSSTGYGIIFYDDASGDEIMSCFWGISCSARLADGHSYTAYIAEFELHAPPSAIQASTAGVGAAEGLELGEMEALLADFPAAAICEEIMLAPGGTHTAGSSVNDQALACNAAVEARVSKGELLKRIAKVAGGVGALWYALHQLAGNGSPNPNPDTAAQPVPLLPPSLPPAWPVTNLAAELRTQNSGLSLADSETVASHCLFFAARSGLSAYSDCARLPIFASGSDVKEATNHDIEALSKQPLWVELEYEPSGPKNDHWKDPFCQDLPMPTGDGTYQCDEYPFLATKQGGPVQPQPDLKYIDGSDNMLQGTRYSQFLTTCGLKTQAEPVFLGIPIPPVLGIPTQTAICGTPSTP